jgi:hypothetical protein
MAEGMDIKPVRLCSSCRYEMKHSPQLCEEIRACQKKYSLSFWQTMTVMNRPLNSVIHDDTDSNGNINSAHDIKVSLVTSIQQKFFCLIFVYICVFVYLHYINVY